LDGSSKATTSTIFFDRREGSPRSMVCRSAQREAQDATLRESHHGEVIDDMAKKKELWSPIAKTWFPLWCGLSGSHGAEGETR